MLLRFTAAFGSFKPGDEIEVPEGAVFDHSYLEEIAEPSSTPDPTPTPAPGE